MAILKKNELKQLDNTKIESKLKELRDRMMKINFQRSTRTTPENPGQVREVRRTIAKLIHLQKRLKSQPKEAKKSKEDERKA